MIKVLTCQTDADIQGGGQGFSNPTDAHYQYHIEQNAYPTQYDEQWYHPGIQEHHRMEHIFLLVQKLTDIGAAATAAAVILNEGSVGDAQVILAQNGIE